MLTDLFIIGIFKLLFVEQFVRRVFANCLAENMPFPSYHCWYRIGGIGQYLAVFGICVF